MSFGVLYPQNDVIAIIDDYAEAERAALALLESGIPGDDIDVLEGQYFLALSRAVAQRRGLVGRLTSAVIRLFSDAAAAQQTLVDEARRGHALLVVHAELPGVAERVRGVLGGYRAHAMRLYRRGSIEDLSA